MEKKRKKKRMSKIDVETASQTIVQIISQNDIEFLGSYIEDFTEEDRKVIKTKIKDINQIKVWIEVCKKFPSPSNQVPIVQEKPATKNLVKIPENKVVRKTLENLVDENIIKQKLWNDDFYLEDYLTKYSGQFIDDDDEILIEMKFDLLRFMRVVQSKGNKEYIIKVKYWIDSLYYEDEVEKKRSQCFNDAIRVKATTFLFNYPGNKYHYLLRHRSSKGGKIQDELVSIFQPLINDSDFWYSGVEFEPFNPQDYDPCIIKSYYNLFPGFQSKIIPDIDPEIYSPFFLHIRDVWAAGNPEYYQYMCYWLATLIQNPTKPLPALILSGKPGCGKTSVTEFIGRYVLGDKMFASLNSMEDALSKFNAHFCSALLLNIQELKGTDHSVNRAEERNKYDIFKSFVTSTKKKLEQKGIDAVFINSYIKIIANSNNDVPVAITDPNDRQSALFKCSEKYVGNKEYFDKLRGTFNQETANHVFTFLLNLTIPKGWDPEKIPQTEIRKNCILGNQKPVERFLRDFITGDYNIAQKVGKNYVVLYYDNIAKKKWFVISKDNLWECYQKWTKDNNDGKTVKLTDFKNEVGKSNYLIDFEKRLPSGGKIPCYKIDPDEISNNPDSVLKYVDMLNNDGTPITENGTTIKYLQKWHDLDHKNGESYVSGNVTPHLEHKKSYYEPKKGILDWPIISNEPIISSSQTPLKSYMNRFPDSKILSN
jgi:hypothetical protein